jgi:predicted HicB family RNase H-like nuclease
VNILQYKGYLGLFKFDPEAHIFHGEIVNTRDVITFEGRSVEELERAIRDSVEDYLDLCREVGQALEKAAQEAAQTEASPVGINPGNFFPA